MAKLVSVAYPLGDVLLLAAAIRLALDAGRREPAFYLRQLEHRAAAGDGLRLRRAHAARRLRPPALARRRLDRLLPAVGRGRAAPVDGARSSSPAAARESVLTRFRLALLTLRVARRARLRASSHDLQRGDYDMAVVTAASIALFGLVVAAHGRPRAPAGALARARADAELGAAPRSSARRGGGRSTTSPSTPPRGSRAPGEHRAGCCTRRARGGPSLVEDGGRRSCASTRRGSARARAPPERRARACRSTMTPRRGEPAVLLVCGPARADAVRRRPRCARSPPRSRSRSTARR